MRINRQRLPRFGVIVPLLLAACSGGKSSNETTARPAPSSPDPGPSVTPDAESGVEVSFEEPSILRTIGEGEYRHALNLTIAGGDAEISYSLSGADASFFEILDGEIVTSREPFDVDAPEAKTTYSVIITATARPTQGEEKTAALSISITVTDSNDQLPSFGQIKNPARVDEDTEDDFSVSFAATPDVTGDMVTYHLSGKHADYFDISEEGLLTPKAETKFEADGPDATSQYEITIHATTRRGADDEQSASIAYILHITDIENVIDLDTVSLAITSDSTATARPEMITISPSTVIYNAKAESDGDLAVVWSLENSDDSLFVIDNETGEVRFKQAITPDHEITASYDFTVIATLSNGMEDKSERLTVRLAVIDINDNPPVFDDTSTASSIEEGMRFTHDFKATPDLAGSPLIYSLSGADARFFDISDEGVVSSKEQTVFEADGPTAKTDYHFSVTARIKDDTQSATIDYALSVIDINDEVPVILSGEPTIQLREHEEVARSTDLYHARGSYDVTPITWSIAQTGAHWQLFTISADADSAHATLRFKEATTPDYESLAEISGDSVGYTVTIIATSGDYQAAKELHFTVENVSEFAPLITSGATAPSRAENEEITATDPLYHATGVSNGGGPIRWSIHKAATSLFTIDSTTGHVTFKSDTIPDHERGDAYHFYVIATTGTSLKSSSYQRVTLSIIDENDEAPRFGAITNPGEIAEGTRFSQSFAATPDIAGDIVTYRIHGRDASLFTISNEGLVTSKETTIFEADGPEPQLRYEFIVLAITREGADDQQISALSYELIVKDIHDEGPIITSDIFAPARAEAARITSDDRIYTATAKGDGGTQVGWSLLGAEDSLFKIHHNTGEVRFKDDITPEFRTNPSYSFTVIATTVSDPEIAFSTRQLVTLPIFNVNNEPPPFGDSRTTGSVAEGYHFRHDFKAIPDVAGDLVTYRLSGPDASYFDISDEGLVTSKDSTVFEADDKNGIAAKTIYNFTVMVTTRAGAPDALSNKIDYRLTVIDINDEPPIFNNDATSGSLAEGSAFRHDFKVTPDVPDDSVTYGLSGVDAGYFDISGAGLVTSKQSTVFEADGADPKTIYNFTVTAVTRKNAFDEKRASLSYRLEITDIHDEASIISSGRTATRRPENTLIPASQQIYQAEATSDGGANIVWYLENEAASLFEIGRTSGVVTFKSATTPDHETTPSYDFTLIARTTQDGQSFSPTQQVTFALTDLNDDAPRFNTASTASNVNEGAGFRHDFSATPDVAGDTVTYSLSGDDEQFFSISDDGRVTSKNDTDFEADGASAKITYNFTVTATTRKDEDDEQSASRGYQLSVTDVSDEPPIFGSSSIASAMDEGTSFSHNFSATPDVAGDTVTYSLSGADASYFDISTAGLVTSKADTVFDADDKNGVPAKTTYNFTVTASTGTGSRIQTATRDYTLSIQDINDEGPIFSPITNPGSVGEGRGRGHFTQAFAATPDIPDDPITFTFSRSDWVRFTLDPNETMPQSVTVISRSSTKFEVDIAKEDEEEEGLAVKSFYIFVVTATTRTGQSDAQSTDLTYRLNVRDINDTPPYFIDDSQTGTVDEGASFSHDFEATSDIDDDTVTYRLSGRDAGYFDISAAGLVTQKSSTVFEADGASAKITYNFIVTAITREDTDDELSISINYRLTVTDIPDEAPIFGTITNPRSITEGASFSQSFAATKDIATDSLTYSLSGTDASYFDISNAGLVTQKSTTVFEADGASAKTSYNFTVTAITREDASDEQSSSISYVLNVIDINDTRPIFGTIVSPRTIAEGITFSQSFAATPDVSGDTVTYILSGDDADDFTISNAGLVTSKSVLDVDGADTKTSYDFIVTATTRKDDDDERSSTIAYKLTVTDANDNAPVFGTIVSPRTIAEGVTFSQSFAATPDVSGDTVTYSLSGDDADDFSISDAGLVTSKSVLDVDGADTKTSYDFTVTATTRKDEDDEQSASVDYVLNITDLHDSAPVITSSASAPNQPENTEIGTDTTLYTATGTSDISTIAISWSLQDADDSLFKIHSTTGVVTFKNPTTLDYEDATSHSFTVIATTKSGTTSLSSTQLVTVNVTNLSESAPQISSGASATARPENTQITASEQIYKGIATADAGAVIRWSIDNATTSLFTINATSGVVTFKSATTPNHETTPFYQFTVIATTGTGSAALSSNQPVRLNITDLNDDAPAFGTITNPRTIAEGARFLQSFAATPDVSGDAVTYSLSGDDASDFSISTTGLVTSKSVLDVDAPDTKTSYDFTVTATTRKGADDELSRSIDYELNVTDINDRLPVFNDTSTTGTVNEGASFSHDFKATPDISGETVTYSLSGDDADDFSISNAGLVTSKTATSFEADGTSAQTTYNFTVTATTRKGASDEQSASLAYKLTVTDIHDEVPALSIASSTIIIPEGARFSQSFAATPDITGDTVTYNLSGDDAEDFTISAAGLITSDDILDVDGGDAKTSYDFTVTATTGPVGDRLSNSANYVLSVTDINDEGPVFDDTSTTGSVDEGASFSHNFKATPDVTGDGIIYSLSGTDSGFFDISDAGLVTSKDDTDFEADGTSAKSSYDFTVTATTRKDADDEQSASIAYKVSVTDIYDAGPVFDDTSNTGKVNEGARFSRNFKATPDVTGEAVTYDLSGTDASYFDISTVGVVTSKTTTNFEADGASAKTSYDFTVTATTRKGASDKQSASIAYKLSVTDVHDVAPVFDDTSTTGSVDEGARFSHNFKATPDVTGGAVTYSLSGTDASYFDISDAGLVTSKDSTGFEADGTSAKTTYNFTVTAMTGEEGDKLSASLAYLLNVTDVHDEAPIFTSSATAAAKPERLEIAADEVIYTATATADIGGRISWSLEDADDSLFEIHSATGKVTFKSATTPDYETISSYSFTVIAESIGGTASSRNIYESKLKVTLPITDESELTFGIKSPATAPSRDENVLIAKTTAIYTAQAGSVPTSAIVWSLEDADDSLFEINSSTGVVTFKSATTPNHEVTPSYKFTVIGTTSKGTDSFTATKEVTLAVTDLNDEAPVFGEITNPRVMNEGLTFSQSFAATPDVAGDRVSYSLSGDDATDFTISDTGLVTSKSVLDADGADAKTSYNFTVTATTRKGADDEQSASIAYKLNLTDLADEGPAFIDTSTSGTLIEDGFFSHGFTAMPDIAGDTVTYILTGDDAGDFEIYEDGLVYSKGTTVFEADGTNAKTSYSFTVTATTRAGAADEKSTSLTYTLSIPDVNDEAPVFNHEAISGAVNEETRFSQSFAATADVTGDDVSYRLSGVDADDFTISNEGLVTSKTSTDLEADGADAKLTYYFTVRATTREGASDAQFAERDYVLNLADVNDQAPVFKNKSTNSYLEERDSFSRSFAATPDVMGDSISYSLSGVDASYFDINTTTGDVSSKADTVFDYDGVNPKITYDFVVTATTRAGRSDERSAELRYRLNITDVNEDAPLITSAKIATARPENTLISASEVIYTATGEAQGSSPISWTLANATTSPFEIDATSGVVTFQSAITPNYEATSSYSFTVIATTGEGADSLSSRRLVTMAVTNLHDVAPVITSSDTALARVENKRIPATTELYRAKATSDAGTYVTWSLMDAATSLFEIDATSGVVTFKSTTTPNYEATASYRFTVIATSGEGANRLSTNKLVTMAVSDQNDKPTGIFLSGKHIFKNGAVTNEGKIASQLTVMDEDDSALSNYQFSINHADFRVNDDHQLIFTGTQTSSSPEAYRFTITMQDEYLDVSHVITQKVIIYHGELFVRPDNLNPDDPSVPSDGRPLLEEEATPNIAIDINGDGVADDLGLFIGTLELVGNNYGFVLSGTRERNTDFAIIDRTKLYYTGAPLDADIQGDSGLVFAVQEVRPNLVDDETRTIRVGPTEHLTRVSTEYLVSNVSTDGRNFARAEGIDFTIYANGFIPYTIENVRIDKVTSRKWHYIGLSKVTDQLEQFSSDKRVISNLTRKFKSDDYHYVIELGREGGPRGLFHSWLYGNRLTDQLYNRPDVTQFQHTGPQIDGYVPTGQILNYKINLIDIDDIPVKVTSPATASAIRENDPIPADFIIYQATGNYDATPITWTLKANSGQSHLFTIDKTTGAVRFKTQTVTDYESRTSYQFTIIATTGELVDEKEVTVAIANISALFSIPTKHYVGDGENNLTDNSLFNNTLIYLRHGEDIGTIIGNNNIISSNGDADQITVRGTNNVIIGGSANDKITLDNDGSETVIYRFGKDGSDEISLFEIGVDRLLLWDEANRVNNIHQYLATYSAPIWKWDGNNVAGVTLDVGEETIDISFAGPNRYSRQQIADDNDLAISLPAVFGGSDYFIIADQEHFPANLSLEVVVILDEPIRTLTVNPYQSWSYKYTARNLGTDTLRYSLPDSGDNEYFTINATTGHLTLKSGQVFSHDAKSTYDITVRASAGIYYDDRPTKIVVNEIPNDQALFALPLSRYAPQSPSARNDFISDGLGSSTVTISNRLFYLEGGEDDGRIIGHNNLIFGGDDFDDIIVRGFHNIVSGGKGTDTIEFEEHDDTGHNIGLYLFSRDASLSDQTVTYKNFKHREDKIYIYDPKHEVFNFDDFWSSVVTTVNRSSLDSTKIGSIEFKHKSADYRLTIIFGPDDGKPAFSLIGDGTTPIEKDDVLNFFGDDYFVFVRQDYLPDNLKFELGEVLITSPIDRIDIYKGATYSTVYDFAVAGNSVGDVIYSISGAAAGYFTINAASGKLALKSNMTLPYGQKEPDELVVQATRAGDSDIKEMTVYFNAALFDVPSVIYVPDRNGDFTLYRRDVRFEHGGDNDTATITGNHNVIQTGNGYDDLTIDGSRNVILPGRSNDRIELEEGYRSTLIYGFYKIGDRIAGDTDYYYDFTIGEDKLYLLSGDTGVSSLNELIGRHDEFGFEVKAVFDDNSSEITRIQFRFYDESAIVIEMTDPISASDYQIIDSGNKSRLILTDVERIFGGSDYIKVISFDDLPSDLVLI